MAETMTSLEFRQQYLKPEYVKRFCVISAHNDKQWIEIGSNDLIPPNMLVGLRMRADLGAWLTYEATVNQSDTGK